MRPCSTSTARCSPSAASAPRRRACRANIDFVEANAEELPFADDTFDAYTIAFGIRNVPRIDVALTEAYRVLKRGGRLLCLEFSEVDMPLLDRVYEAWSFNAIPKIGQAGHRRRRALPYLVESIRKFPNQREFRRHDHRGRLLPRHFHQLYRRHRRAAFRLEDLTDDVQRMSACRRPHLQARTGRLGAGPRRRRLRPAGEELAGLPKFGWRMRAAVHAPPRASHEPQRPAGRAPSSGSGRPM